jgi:hypothetical protein
MKIYLVKRLDPVFDSSTSYIHLDSDSKQLLTDLKIKARHFTPSPESPREIVEDCIQYSHFAAAFFVQRRRTNLAEHSLS